MQLVFRITQFNIQYPRFIRDRGKRLVEQIILPKIKQRMADFNYSPKIIKGTTVQDVLVDTNGFMDIDIVSEFKTESGFDVAKAREKGTKDHFVAPIIKKALSFLLQGATGIIGAFRVFSKGHWVKGIRKSNVIEKTIEEFTPQVQASLNVETDEFFLKKVEI